MAEVEQKRKVHWLVVVFALFHAWAIFAWSMPFPSNAPDDQDNLINKFLKFNSFIFRGNNFPLSDPEEKPVLSYVERFRSPGIYLLYTGTWQYWDMFAPNPASTDIWMDARVIYQDGHEEIYQYPRMKELGIVEKYFKERYRKYYERLNNDIYAFKWPHTAYWVARQMDKYPDNPPAEVILRRHFLETLPPGQESPTEYTAYEFYGAWIDAKVLRGKD